MNHPTLRDVPPAIEATHRDALRRLWFLGDPHGGFDHIERALLQVQDLPKAMPSWLVFLGDITPEGITFREALEPVRRRFPQVRIAFIHGNHDADEHENWARLHDCGDAVALHGQVVDLGGVRVAGLGGNFLGRNWAPPKEPVMASRREATYRHPNLVRRGQNHAPSLHAAIYKDEVDTLASQRADILVTHEAFSCHHHGWETLDQLARDLRVERAFHGHTHDDRTEEYRAHRDRLGFEAVAVNYRCIKNGLGEVVYDHTRMGSTRGDEA